MLPDRGEVFCGSNGYCKSRFDVMVTKIQGQLQPEIKKIKNKIKKTRKQQKFICAGS